MKKTLCLVAAAFLLISASGCAGIAKAQNFTGQEKDNASIVEIFTGKVTYPKEYFISYEVTGTDGVISTITKAIDASGNVYYQNGADQVIFVRTDGNTYSLHKSDAHGIFMPETNGESYTDNYISEYTQAFNEYAETSRQSNMPTAKDNGNAKLLGRNAQGYQISVGLASFNKNYDLLVDQETGICLGWNESGTVGNTEIKPDGEIFTCVIFQTENVTLPNTKATDRR